jgi:uncharacterized protein
MPDNKKYFFLKLNPPRSTFAIDMSDEERKIMLQHVRYWVPFVENNTAIVLGPVADPKGAYGIAVVSVESEEHLKELIAADPAKGLNTYEYYPMRAVTKQ